MIITTNHQTKKNKQPFANKIEKKSLSIMNLKGEEGFFHIEKSESNKSPERRLNLSRSWHKGHSHAYNT